MTHPALRTRICEMFGIEHPIVQTGMGYVSGPRLTAATSEAGGLGILGAATMELEELRRAVAEVKRATSKPFGVNMRADQADIAARADLLIEQGVRVASFAMAPKPDVIARLKEGGVLIVPSIGAKRHAEKVVAMGADAILVQGGEGGGHTGPVATTLLLPQIVDTVDVPVIAAGGFFDGRGLVAALAYGASGVAMGTRFLLTSDCEVPDRIKQIYLQKTVTDTVVTTKVDGVPHRVLRTDFIDELERANDVAALVRAARNALAFKKESRARWGDIVREGLAMKKSRELSWAQVVMAANTPGYLRAAMVEGDSRFGVMASGQVVGMIEDLPSCAELVPRIVREAEDVLARLGKGAAP